MSSADFVCGWAGEVRSEDARSLAALLSPFSSLLPSPHACEFPLVQSESATFMPNINSRACGSFGSGGGPGNGQGGGYGGGHATVGNKPACGGCDSGCETGPFIAGITGVVPVAPDSIGDEDFVRVFFGGKGGGGRRGGHSRQRN